MFKSQTLEKTTCYHCGDDCETIQYVVDDKSFCCQGCKSVYEVLSAGDLCNYYSYNEHPGATRARTDKRFDYLSEPTIINDLIDYKDKYYHSNFLHSAYSLQLVLVAAREIE